MPNNLPTDKTRKRIARLFCLVLVCFAVLAGRLFYVQILEGKELQERASSQWSRAFTINARRGEITDRNGKVLAQSSSAVTITATPGEVVGSDSEDEESKEERIRMTARKLAELLEEDEQTIYDRITDTSRKSVRVARQVKLEIGDAVNAADLDGIYVEEDTVRAYPMGDLLTQVIGFCTSSGEGQEGLEKSLDDVLSGTDGRVVSEIDARSNRMETGEEEYTQPENGLTVRLTVDYVLQATMESIADRALEETGAERVMAVMMNPQTGEILGMVNRPGFDLNSPPRSDLTELNRLIRNACIKNDYEPGALMESITAALALEKGVTDLNETFTCKGENLVDTLQITCWRNGRAHGEETLEQALGNACDPVFAQLALRVGMDDFYQGLLSFGVGQDSGIDLDGAAAGELSAYKYVQDRDIVSMARGEDVTLTPVQLLTAGCAVVNGGELLRPHIVSAYVNEDGEVTESFEREVISTPLSAETSQSLREMLTYAVEEGTAHNAALQGYSIGGSVGSSPKEVDGKKSETLCVSSFMGFAPMDNPQIGLLLVVDGVSGEDDAGIVTAAGYAREILGETLRYMGLEATESDLEEARKTVEMPAVNGQTVDAAVETLSAAGLHAEIVGTGETITSQMPAAGEDAPADSLAVLYTEEAEKVEDNLTEVPDLSGKTMVQADRALRAMGLTMKIKGAGTCISQDPAAGEHVEKGTAVTVEFG